MRSSRHADFEAFALASGPALRRFALHLGADCHEADDLLQETLLRLSLHWRRAEVASPMPYARQVLLNLVRDAARRRARRPETVGLPAGPDVANGSDPAGQVVRREQVIRALADLPPQMRAVVVLRHIEDLSESETAYELGIPLGSVKSQGSRGLKRLRAALDLQDANDAARR